MSERYIGGFITKSPTAPTSVAAPGVWTLDQAMQYTKAGTWPMAGQGYLMAIGTGSSGSLDRNANFNAVPAATTNQETIYYGPWNGGSTTGNYLLGTSFLIKTDGTLWATGTNNKGQLGINQYKPDASGGSSSNTFVQVGSLTDWLNAKISVGGGNAAGGGDAFVVAIKSNGTLWSWGDGTNGALGQNNTADKSSPTQIGSDTTWQNVAAASYCWIATKTDGSIWACGRNLFGQLGQNNTTDRSSPVQIGALTDWGNAFLAAGVDYFSVVKTNGTLWSWGNNSSGRLGQNIASTTHRSSPVQVGALTTWSKVFSTGDATFGITTAGALWAWGDASNGALAGNNQTNRSSPVQVGALTNWSTVASRNARYTAIAIKTDGTLWHWGNITGAFQPAARLSSPVQIGSDTDWSTIVNGYNTRYFDGKTPTLYVAQLAFKTTKNRPYGSGDPQQASYTNPLVQVNWPVLLTDDKWSSVTNASYTSVGIKNTGTLWAWGSSGFGQLGQSDVVARSSPVQVGALTNWKSVIISYQNDANEGSVLAINNSNELYAWGYNGYAQLGQNNLTNRSSPVQVGALTTWKQAAASRYASFSTKVDGTLWSWGQNSSGELGQNLISTALRSSPVQIGVLTDWEYVSAGIYSAAAVKTDNTLWAWGAGTSGILGNNSVVNRSSPIQVGALTNWLKVSVGNEHCLAIKTDGTLWAWGSAVGGKIGDGVAVNRSSPVQIGSATNWKDVLATNSVSMAITTSGLLYVWGLVATSQSGTETIYRSSPVQLGASSYYLSFNNSRTNSLDSAFIQTNATS